MRGVAVDDDAVLVEGGLALGARSGSTSSRPVRPSNSKPTSGVIFAVVTLMGPTLATGPGRDFGVRPHPVPRVSTSATSATAPLRAMARSSVPR